jgi:ATP-dependent DNA helicase RecQ
MAVGTSLKILEREGYIERARERSGNAYFRLLKDFGYVVDSLNARAKKQTALLHKLYDRYGAELAAGWEANFEEAAELLGVSRESLQRLVRKLADSNLAEYRPPFRGTEIKIKKRVERAAIAIDHKALQEKLDRAYRKLDRIEEYAYYSSCRQKYILDYFGDSLAQACGKCDNCLAAGGYRRKTKAPDRWAKESGRPAKLEKLPTKLTQLETFDLYNQGMDIGEMAAERGVTAETIVNHLCYLAEKGLPVDTAKFVTAAKRKKIRETAKEVGAEKLKPIKEKLGEEITYGEIKLTLAKKK